MTEPITLTTYEIDELKRHITAKAPLIDPLDIIAAVILKLNQLREPLPLGTVRADENGNVAVKVYNDAYHDPWAVYRFDGTVTAMRETDHAVKDWPIVHRPK